MTNKLSPVTMETMDLLSISLPNILFEGLKQRISDSVNTEYRYFTDDELDYAVELLNRLSAEVFTTVKYEFAINNGCFGCYFVTDDYDKIWIPIKIEEGK
jgi:cellulase/cellobiase CelA1